MSEDKVTGFKYNSKLSNPVRPLNVTT